MVDIVMGWRGLFLSVNISKPSLFLLILLMFFVYINTLY